VADNDEIVDAKSAVFASMQSEATAHDERALRSRMAYQQGNHKEYVSDLVDELSGEGETDDDTNDGEGSDDSGTTERQPRSDDGTGDDRSTVHGRG